MGEAQRVMTCEGPMSWRFQVWDEDPGLLTASARGVMHTRQVPPHLSVFINSIFPPESQELPKPRTVFVQGLLPGPFITYKPLMEIL